MAYYIPRCWSSPSRSNFYTNTNEPSFICVASMVIRYSRLFVFWSFCQFASSKHSPAEPGALQAECHSCGWFARKNVPQLPKRANYSRKLSSAESHSIIKQSSLITNGGSQIRSKKTAARGFKSMLWSYQSTNLIYSSTISNLHKDLKIKPPSPWQTSVHLLPWLSWNASYQVPNPPSNHPCLWHLRPGGVENVTTCVDKMLSLSQWFTQLFR